ncbi:CbtA family protein [Streptomyces nigra]|uniref:CbtA family protein n=1 Tax=Streptomyces nigra TaxID=1827580 RepID=UPI0037F38903
MQSTAGLARGVIVFSIAIGGIAALEFCFALGRTGRFGTRATAALTALTRFLLVDLVPIRRTRPPSATRIPNGERTILLVGNDRPRCLAGHRGDPAGSQARPGVGQLERLHHRCVAFVAVMAVARAVLPNGKASPRGSRRPTWGSPVWHRSAFRPSRGVPFGFLAERVLEPKPVRAASSAQRPPEREDMRRGYRERAR